MRSELFAFVVVHDAALQSHRKSELVKMEGELVGKVFVIFILSSSSSSSKGEYLDVEFLITMEWMPPQGQSESDLEFLIVIEFGDTSS
jgi:hypothetical protein